MNQSPRLRTVDAIEMFMLAGVPVSEISLTIVDVIHIRKRVIRIINDDRATKEEFRSKS